MADVEESPLMELRQEALRKMALRLVTANQAIGGEKKVLFDDDVDAFTHLAHSLQRLELSEADRDVHPPSDENGGHTHRLRPAER